jgi:hypothetical protein
MFTAFREWAGTHRREIALFILMFLISTFSFGLGYLLGGEGERAPIIIEKITE